MADKTKQKARALQDAYGVKYCTALRALRENQMDMIKAACWLEKGQKQQAEAKQ